MKICFLRVLIQKSIVEGVNLQSGWGGNTSSRSLAWPDGGCPDNRFGMMLSCCDVRHVPRTYTEYASQQPGHGHLAGHPVLPGYHHARPRVEPTSDVFTCLFGDLFVKWYVFRHFVSHLVIWPPVFCYHPVKVLWRKFLVVEMFC